MTAHDSHLTHAELGQLSLKRVWRCWAAGACRIAGGNKSQVAMDKRRAFGVRALKEWQGGKVPSGESGREIFLVRGDEDGWFA